MKAILVRIGIDHEYGAWNAPMSLKTNKFVFVPIPENDKTIFRKGMERGYEEVFIPLVDFCSSHKISLKDDLNYPINELQLHSMHLDPDFEHLTYGDNGTKRGSQIKTLKRGDFLVFYAGLRPIEKHTDKLVYAIVGFYSVEEVVNAINVNQNRYLENAHTRKKEISKNDIVVRANLVDSGRLAKCIPIGEYRDRAYRVQKNILSEWGGLSVNDGYIQRSAVPPSFNNPEMFLKWFQKQKPIFERTKY